MIIGIYYLLSCLRYHILQYTYGRDYIAKFVSCKTGTSFDSRVVDLTWGLLISASALIHAQNLDTLPRLGLFAIIRPRVTHDARAVGMSVTRSNSHTYCMHIV
jgi:hypothetical protein